MTDKLIAALAAVVSFIISYSFKIVADNSELYLAVVSVISLDGFGGITRAVKRRDFRTYKAIKTVKKLFTWTFILTVTLFIEKGFTEITWLSETVITPFIILEFISSLKNLSAAKLIKLEVLNNILKDIDKHKDETI